MKRTARIIGISLVLALVLGLLSAAMTPDWGLAANRRHIGVSSSDTAIRARGATTAQEGRYRTRQSTLRITLTPTVTIHAILREPIDAPGERPACLLIQGAGTGKAADVYGDIASAMASAGIVTLVPDKRLDDYSTLHRNYDVMADNYLTSLRVLRSLPNVDGSKAGIYAESEGTWISMLMAAKDPQIPFMILTSPPVVSGRRQMSMAATSYLSIAGAPQSLIGDIPKIMSLDFSCLGLHYADFPAQRYMNDLTMPLLINYGAEDPSMPIEQGAADILDHASRRGNRNVTIRYYRANHQMRVGSSLSKPGLPLVSSYTHNLENWVNAVCDGTTATGWQTPLIAGAQPRQRFAAPSATRPGLVGSLSTVLIMVIGLVTCLIAAAAVGIVLAAGSSRHPRRFAARIRPLLTATALLAALNASAFAVYMVVLVHDALTLRNQAAILTAGWTALRCGAWASVVLCAWLVEQMGENALVARTPGLHVRRTGGGAPGAIGTGFGAHLCAALVIAAAVLSLGLMAFWGLFSW
ncbi:MAG: alpha/beta hydrolase [Bifidobacterium sp.]|nr:alpha/beta hydrolase [Bifidobacterium sp.]MCI1864825.1 alpha/beta hydrolase [Bifidobacterium sp.]